MPEKEKLKINVRILYNKNIKDIIPIDRLSFPKDRWTTEQFIDELKDNFGIVAKCGNIIIGYLFYKVHKNKIEILKVAVAPEYRRFGVATELVKRIKNLLINSEIKTLSIVLREDSLESQLFFKSVDFVAKLPIKKNHFEDYEDGYYMEYVSDS